MAESKATKTARAWLAKFGSAVERQDVTAAKRLFGEECYWRDLVSLSWNIKTVEGRDGIGLFLSTIFPYTRISRLELLGIAEQAGETIEAWFTFQTAVARGKGHLRLRNGKGFTVLTTMTELIGHEELAGPTREKGIAHGAFKHRKTWLDRKSDEEIALGSTQQPNCVIIGGGQGGIALGARLKRLGVPAIILEKNKRAGDSWRSRYRTLVLHDPVWYDHLPYIPFPEHWPVFTPKDKMGDWLEAYVSLMELTYWTSSECLKADYDAISRTWMLRVIRDGREMTLQPKQLVFATGSYGPPREPKIPGAESFTGEFYHSSRYQSGARYRGKSCVVIGANSSGHDVAADLWESDADVTMIQRTPTTVVRSETLMEHAFASLYSQEAVQRGTSVDIADLIFASTPFRLMAAAQVPIYKTIAQQDAGLLAQLNKAGFLTDFGEDDSGLMMKALRTGSGYYLDVGCSELIATGKIKVRSRVEVASIGPRSVVLTDGAELPADLIVAATGYLPMNEWVAKIISRDVADLIGPNWGYGSGTKGDPGPWEGELRNMWKPLTHDALWFHGGNLHLSRHYSLYLALQLKARMEGIETRVV